MIEERDKVMEGYLAWCASRRVVPYAAWSIKRYRRVYRAREKY